MKQRISSVFLATALFVLAVGSALAEDIDIFSGNRVVSAAPNVLLLIDNSANWNSRYSDEKQALATIVSNLTNQFNLGLMFYNESPMKGGFVRFAIQSMSNADGSATEARKCLLKMMGVTDSTANCTSANPYYVDITNSSVDGDKSNAGYLSLGMAEAYSYFAGHASYRGGGAPKRDPLAFVNGNGSQPGDQYVAPGQGIACGKNYIIHISNGGQESNTTSVDAQTYLTTSPASGDGAVIVPPDLTQPYPSKNTPADEWARFLFKQSAVQVVTYVLEVDPDTTGQGPYYTSLMQSMARQGKGSYFSAASQATILANLTRIFNDIQARNSIFASASLPLSADQSGAYSDQIYMGVFRPDSNPRWFGNLKQYKFSVDSNKNLKVTDAVDLPAAGTSGLAQPDAISFWTSKDTSVGPDAPATPATSLTTGSTGGFWYFDAKGPGGSYDRADGEWVEKGGAAQQLRLAYLGYANRGGIGDTNASTPNSLPARQLFTCTTACISGVRPTALSGTPFDTSNSDITDAALGTSSKTINGITAAAPKTVSALSAGVSVGIVSVDPSTATVTTSATHSFAAGDKITIVGNSKTAINGDYTITSTPTVPATTFTISPAPNGQLGTGGTATQWTKTATATSTAHGLSVGQKITISGATPTGFNGSYTVEPAGFTTDTFTYTLSSALGTIATGSTILAYPNIATVDSTAHGFTTGQSITISGVTNLAALNGVFVITSTGPDSFTYNFRATTGTSGSAAGSTLVASVAGGRTTLIGWVRGFDTQDENGFKVNNADTDVRASIHADVLHSRPVVINYGSPSTGDNPYIFYGGNDGVFRAVKGGQATTDGKEQWGFIPTEFFGKLKRIYDNSPAVLYSSTTPGLVPAPTKRDYFWDGQTGTYIERDAATGALTKALLFITARRGGRFIYALDVTTVGSPKFLWKKGCTTAYPDNSGCDTGFEELAQTWSTPVAVKVAANTNPVVMFGGGYDATAEDAEPPTTNQVGRAVFVLDAYTGALLFTAGHATGAPVAKSVTGMDYSFPADVLAMDRNQTGLVNRVYAADVGGNLWRIDTGDASMSNWTISKVAALGDRSTVANTRKFFFGPDVVVGDSSSYDAVIIVSGDREHPLKTNGAQNVTNRVYMVKDTNTVSVGTNLAYADPSSNNSPPTASTSCGSSCLYDATNSSTVPATAGGWYVTLRTGEKAVNGPIVVSGEVFFGTNQPDPSISSCVGDLGIARRYDINFLTGASGSLTDAGGLPVRSEEITGGGFLPSPIAGMVNIGGIPYPFILDNPLASPSPPTPTFDVAARRFRTHWRELLE